MRAQGASSMGCRGAPQCTAYKASTAGWIGGWGSGAATTTAEVAAEREDEERHRSKTNGDRRRRIEGDNAEAEGGWDGEPSLTPPIPTRQRKEGTAPVDVTFRQRRAG